MKKQTTIGMICAAALIVSGLLCEGATTLSADEALQALREGNARYTAGKPLHPDQDASRRAKVTGGQDPFASVLSCSDSRVPPEILFDQGMGDVFVVRVAGNVANTDEVGTLEYGIGHLHTPLLVVMGHEGCGAVKAVISGAEVHGDLADLVANIAPAVARAKAEHPDAAGPELLSSSVKENVWVAIEDLFRRSGEVRQLVEAGKLKVVGALYHLGSGEVDWMGPHPDQAKLLSTGEAKKN